MKRIVVIGAGRWAHIMHQPALSVVQDKGLIEVCGVCDLDTKASLSFSKPFADAKCFDDADKMIAELKPDGVVLLLTPSLLPSFIERAAHWGLPFICEKPPAPDAIVHKKLIEVVGDLPHLVGYNRRFSPFVQKAKFWIKSEKLTFVHCTFARYRRVNEDFSTTFVHGLDTSLYLLGQDLSKLNACVDYFDGYYDLYLNGKSSDQSRMLCEFLPNVASSLEHYEVKGEGLCVDLAFAQSGMIDLPGFVEKHIDNEIAEHCSHYDLGIKAVDVFHLGGFVDEYLQFSALLNGKSHIDSSLSNTYLTQAIRDQIVKGVASKKEDFAIDLAL